MDYDMKELTEIAEAGSKRIKELEAELRKSCLSELAALDQAQEAYEKQKELEAQRDELMAIIDRMDEVSPKADHTCDEPGITLSEACRRELADHAALEEMNDD